MLNKKYRPNRFCQIKGQGLIPETLRKQVESGRVVQVYLLSGNRGSGKTTTARIFANALTCEAPEKGEPCGKCHSCLSESNPDIVELDAASNNGVQDIRDIINQTSYVPNGKAKVYIIDEAHMITNAGANAFLKTLEEPPENVYFILATTDPQKLPITILSRCQRYDFRRIHVDEIVNNLMYICLEENITFEEEALYDVAKMADGAMRDAISILEQVSSSGAVTKKEVDGILGTPSDELMLTLYSQIINKNVGALETLQKLNEAGKDPIQVIQRVIEHLKNTLLVKVVKNPIIIMPESVILTYRAYKDNVSESYLTYLVNALKNDFRSIERSNNPYGELEMTMISMISDTETNTMLRQFELLKKEISEKLQELSSLAGQDMYSNKKDTKEEIIAHPTNEEIINHLKKEIERSSLDDKVKTFISKGLEISSISYKDDYLYFENEAFKNNGKLLSSIKNKINKYLQDNDYLISVR